MCVLNGQPEIEFACELEGELTLLSELVKRPRSTDHYSKYAQWLSDQGDEKRAEFLRSLAEHIEDPDQKLPRLFSYDTPWTDLTGLALIRTANHLGLGAHTKTLLSMARPMLKIELENTIKRPLRSVTDVPHENDEFPIGASKFDGTPDLPDGLPWPTGSHGPLKFLAQFNLEELAGLVPIHWLPVERGVLSVFSSFREHEPDPSGCDETCRVIYLPDPASLIRTNPPKELDEEWENGPAVKLHIVESLDLPGNPLLDCPKFMEGFGEMAELNDTIHEIRCELNPFTYQLFGYPVDFQSNQDSTPDSYQHFLTLSGSSQNSFFWGDGDRLNISIPMTKLESMEDTPRGCGIVG